MNQCLSIVIWTFAVTSLWSAPSVAAQCRVPTVEPGAIERALVRLTGPRPPPRLSPWRRLRVLLPKRARWRHGQARQDGLGQSLDSDGQRRDRAYLGQRSNQVFELSWDLSPLWPSPRSHRSGDRDALARVQQIEAIASRTARRYEALEVAHQQAASLQDSDPRCHRLRAQTVATLMVLRTMLPELRRSRASPSTR